MFIAKLKTSSSEIRVMKSFAAIEQSFAIQKTSITYFLFW